MPMARKPIDYIVDWSKRLLPWQQDAMRRLSISEELSDADLQDLLAIIKQAAGFNLATPAPTPKPLCDVHFVNSKYQPVVLKGIANVQNVNRLVSKAQLDFCPNALTVVYGRNGSGKSGFVRILRTACRTRVEKRTKLKVLSDVYGSDTGPQKAEIIVDDGNGDTSIDWTDNMTPVPQLQQIAVFDTLSAQFYVDAGSQIRYLPFGLALPHRLNSVCLKLKDTLTDEMNAAVGNDFGQQNIDFQIKRATSAQEFDSALSHFTSDDEINKATNFSEHDKWRLNEGRSALSADAAAVADLKAFIAWIESFVSECEAVEINLSDEAMSDFSMLRSTAVMARHTAQLSADDLFNDMPLNGVGSESWRSLWVAARNYSITEAYVGAQFPVTSIQSRSAACVLCQQPLHSDGASRMQRFRDYMDNKLETAAKKAERAVAEANSELLPLTLMKAADFDARIEQVRQRREKLADALVNFRESASQRRIDAADRLAGKNGSTIVQLVSPHTELLELANELMEELNALERVGDAQEREKLEREVQELADREILSTKRAELTKRRDILKTKALFDNALKAVQTRGITQSANEFVDTHLTSAVKERFDKERDRFDIMHLNVSLSRKSNQTKAEFAVNPRTTLTKVTSDILSEGEHRALALVGFLTEVAMTDRSGPVIVDDPVSSLDRDCSARVAERLAEEASHRQVVVFTHDIIFFNELCSAADDRGIEPVTIALFSDQDAAGKIDAAGMVWKGLSVNKRIGKIRKDFAPLQSLHKTSKADYEYQLKNLYGRLRDTYERAVEEIIFRDIVRRGSDVIQTQKLRYVVLSDELVERFHKGMTRANAYCHDNPAADTILVPTPDQFIADVNALEQLIEELNNESIAAEKRRKTMKPKR